MEIVCCHCQAVTEHIPLTDVVKDKRLNTDGHHYWQMVQCTVCNEKHWTDRRRE